MLPHPAEVAGYLKELAFGMLDVGMCYTGEDEAGSAAALEQAADLELAERGLPAGLRFLSRRHHDHRVLQVEPAA